MKNYYASLHVIKASSQAGNASSSDSVGSFLSLVSASMQDNYSENSDGPVLTQKDDALINQWLTGLESGMEIDNDDEHLGDVSEHAETGQESPAKSSYSNDNDHPWSSQES